MSGCEDGPHRTAVVILAAGMSSRFGGNKLLYKIGGIPIIMHTVGNAFRSNADDVILVIGESLLNSDAVIPQTVKVVVNREPRRGLGHSISLGVSLLTRECCSCILLLADQPLVSGTMLNELMALHNSNSGSIVAYSLDGSVRNPVLFSRDFFSELYSLEGDKGARELVLSKGSSVIYIEAKDRSHLIDVDERKDADRVSSELSRKSRQ